MRARACHALSDAGGVTEISRWWSESANATTGSQHEKGARPGGTMEHRDTLRRVLRGGSILHEKSGGSRSRTRSTTGLSLDLIV